MKFLVSIFLFLSSLWSSFNSWFWDSNTPPTPDKLAIVTPTNKPVPTASVVATKSPTPTPKLPTLSGSQIFNAVNQYRFANSKPQFSVSDELCGIAERRADYMMKDDMAAFKASGTGNHSGLRDISYSGNQIGENLAANVANTASVMSIWEKSPPHNALLLTTDKDGSPITKACVATRVSQNGSIVVLMAGDK